jgi:putative restriction endonuclease
MTRSDVRKKFSEITVWKQGDKRAPHKPLLLLYLLGRIARGEENSVSFDEVDENVGQLLDEFGPPRKTQAIMPFWYLQNDGFWELSNISWESPTKLDSYPSKGTMKERDVHGSLTRNVYEQLTEDRHLLNEVAGDLLRAHFPNTFHDDILQAIGLSLDSGFLDAGKSTTKPKRDRSFREKVIRAYQYRCAVCGFNVRMGNTLIALEAAHIKWHQAGGPDIEYNGLALCSMHHKLFDRVAFTLNEDNIFMVSDYAHGTTGFDEWLMRLHGEKLKPPQRQLYSPHNDFTTWHVNEVFRGDARE